MTLPPLFAFGVLIAASAAAYPGGTWSDPHRRGFSFWDNFWCDLLATIALDGHSNRMGALLARCAFACFALALLRFWPRAAAFAGRRPGGASEHLGTFGALGVFAVALVPASTSQTAHGVAVVLSAAGSVAAVVPLVPALWRRGSKRAASFGAGALATALACLLQYVYQGCWAREAAAWLAGAQKIATVLLLAFMLQLTMEARAQGGDARMDRPT